MRRITGAVISIGFVAAVMLGFVCLTDAPAFKQVENNFMKIRSELFDLSFEVGQLRELNRSLDLSVLDSCGVITNGQGHGSCVAIRPNLILTAGHCIGINGAWIEIGGKRYEILSSWRDSESDVGFFRIDGVVPFLSLGEDPEILDPVYIVGAPRSIGFFGVSKGVVTKTNIVDWSNEEVNWNGNFVCDAMTYFGCSGGPTLNPHGLIVGIYVGLFLNGDNFSVCVPVSRIKKSLIAYEANTEELDNALP